MAERHTIDNILERSRVADASKVIYKNPEGDRQVVEESNGSKVVYNAEKKVNGGWANMGRYTSKEAAISATKAKSSNIGYGSRSSRQNVKNLRSKDAVNTIDSKPTVDSLLQRSRDGIASHQEPSNEEYAKLLKMKPKTGGMHNFEITSEAGRKIVKAKSFSEAKALFAKKYPNETLKNISYKGADSCTKDVLLERSRVGDAGLKVGETVLLPNGKSGTLIERWNDPEDIVSVKMPDGTVKKYRRQDVKPGAHRAYGVVRK